MLVTHRLPLCAPGTGGRTGADLDMRADLLPPVLRDDAVSLDEQLPARLPAATSLGLQQRT